MAIKSAPWQMITEAPPKKGTTIILIKRLEIGNEGAEQLTQKPR
jgi:hypothetical protein